MKAKITVTMILLSSLLLSSCTSNASEETSVTPKSENTTQSSNYKYYETEIDRLTSELLDLKEEMYISKKDYENKINELNSQIKDLESTQNGNDSIFSDMDNISFTPYIYNIEENKLTITKYCGNSNNVTVPSKIDGKQVYKIGENSFDASIDTIYIEEGIEIIDWFAFSKCTSLSEIYIPSSVRLINYGAFDNRQSSLIIKCKKGSYAEAYAKSYGIICVTV